MKTKAFVLTAALAVASFASAQSNTYSLNVVGYVNVTLPTGYSVISNPLNATNAGGNSVSNLFRTLNPLGSVVYTWNGSGLTGNNLDDFDGTWSDANAQLPVGKGFFFRNLTGAPITNTFMGEVPQGVLSYPITSGYNLLGLLTPQAGYARDIGLRANPGDIVYLWNGTGLSSSSYDDFDETWTPMPGFPVDSGKGPFIQVGQGFFYRNLAGGTFGRNFTVP